MPVIRVDVAPNVINWALQYAPPDKIADKFRDLDAWLYGEKQPTFNQIESLSKVTNVPLGYFFLKNPPVEELPLLKYRTINSIDAEKPSRNLIDTIHHMESVQEWMRDYLINSGAASLEFIGSKASCQDVAELAVAIREGLELSNTWFRACHDTWATFKFVREKLENTGVLVMMNGIVEGNTRRSLDIEEFRAFTLIDEFAPLVFINSNDSSGGKLFSLLHETVHLWLGVNSLYNDRTWNTGQINATEVLCNAVTAEILVPNALFIREWKKQTGNELSRIKTLRAWFKCGITTIARRALDNKYISSTQYNEIARGAIQQYKAQKAKQNGGDYYASTSTRLDNRFLIALDNSLHEGTTQYTDAYKLTNTSRKTFSKIVEKARGVK